MKKTARKIRIHSTAGLRSAMFWRGFRDVLAKAKGENREHAYIAAFTQAAQLKPAEYQFGESRVSL